MRIALDAMGGDNAPHVNVAGAVAAARDYGIEIILVGDNLILRRELLAYPISNLKISIEPASQVVAMGEPPTVALRQKKDSSITRAISLVKEGKAEAVISAGNTGAMMATAKVILGSLKGVDRPAIATLFPTLNTPCVLLDVGANVDCRPQHIFQFAVMGSIYAQHILGKKNPRVGLLSIGEEESKGNELTREAYKLLQKSSLNFMGNVEGKDIYSGKADVIVSDGFTGNVALKASEGVVEMLFSTVRREIMKNILARIGFFLMNKNLKRIYKKLDYSEYGGAHLLGIDGVCIIGHGRSNSNAVKNAVRVAKEFVMNKVKERIQQEFTRATLGQNGI